MLSATEKKIKSGGTVCLSYLSGFSGSSFSSSLRFSAMKLVGIWPAW